MKAFLDCTRQTLEGGRVHRYTLFRANEPLRFDEVLGLWQHDEDFRSFFGELLAVSPWPAYRWETPPLTTASAGREFEFVLVDAPEIDLAADAAPFAGHFRRDRDSDEGEASIAVFANLGGDATMVVPSPRAAAAAYGHLAAFMRHGPPIQRHALWQVVGRTMEASLSDRPAWLSTAGGGVAWLHVRVDSVPKYYAHDPYRGTEPES